MKKIKELKFDDTAYLFNKRDCSYEECEISWNTGNYIYTTKNGGFQLLCDSTPNYEYYAVPVVDNEYCMDHDIILCADLSYIKELIEKRKDEINVNINKERGIISQYEHTIDDIKKKVDCQYINKYIRISYNDNNSVIENYWHVEDCNINKDIHKIFLKGILYDINNNTCYIRRYSSRMSAFVGYNTNVKEFKIEIVSKEDVMSRVKRFNDWAFTN